MDLTVGAWVAVLAAVLLGATIQGAIGFGMNLVAVPVLALVAPDTLPIAAILFGVPISLAMVRYERADLDRPGLAWVLGGRVPGRATLTAPVDALPGSYGVTLSGRNLLGMKRFVVVE